MLKKLICATLILSLLLSIPAFAGYWPASEYSGTMFVHGCRVSVTLRQSPSTKSAELMQIPRDAEVWCEPYSDTFARVLYRGVWGYVLTEYLDFEIEGDTWNYWWVVNCNEWVSLRSAPNSNAGVLARVPLGARVLADYEGVTNGFRQAEYNGYTGWIKVQYLSQY